MIWQNSYVIKIIKVIPEVSNVLYRYVESKVRCLVHSYSSHSNLLLHLTLLTVWFPDYSHWDVAQVLDYSQYFLDLSRATDPETEAEWTLLYNFTDFYDVKEPSAEELHNIAENFTTRDSQAPATGEAFIKWVRSTMDPSYTIILIYRVSRLHSSAIITFYFWTT